MKLGLIVAALALSACVGAQCTPSSGGGADASPPTPGIPDGQGPPAHQTDGSVTVYDAACFRMNELQCPAGARSDCAVVFQQTVEQRLIVAPTGKPLDALCVVAALVAADVQRCGIACPK